MNTWNTQATRELIQSYGFGDAGGIFQTRECELSEYLLAKCIEHKYHIYKKCDNQSGFIHELK